MQSFDVLRQDIQFAIRQLVRSPAFTIIAVVTLALGIGANTAIFSVVYSVLLKPLPYANSDRIFLLRETGSGMPYGDATFGNWNDWRTRSTTFEAIGAMWGMPPLTLTSAGEPTPIETSLASAEYWKAMCIPTGIATHVSQADNVAGAPAVAVLLATHRSNRISGDRNIAGRPMTLRGRAFTVVGVAPPDSILYQPAEKISIPLAAPPSRLKDNT